jgi:hypothetical protein
MTFFLCLFSHLTVTDFQVKKIINVLISIWNYLLIVSNSMHAWFMSRKGNPTDAKTYLAICKILLIQIITRFSSHVNRLIWRQYKMHDAWGPWNLIIQYNRIRSIQINKVIFDSFVSYKRFERITVLYFIMCFMYNFDYLELFKFIIFSKFVWEEEKCKRATMKD